MAIQIQKVTCNGKNIDTVNVNGVMVFGSKTTSTTTTQTHTRTSTLTVKVKCTTVGSETTYNGQNDHKNTYFFSAKTNTGDSVNLKWYTNKRTVHTHSTSNCSSNASLWYWYDCYLYLDYSNDYTSGTIAIELTDGTDDTQAASVTTSYTTSTTTTTTVPVRNLWVK